MKYTRIELREIKDTNRFLQIAIFLDSEKIQNKIKFFRFRIGLKTPILYESFDDWKIKGIKQDNLSRQEISYLEALDRDIDLLENLPRDFLTKEKERELHIKNSERIKWIEPYYSFSRAVKNFLKEINKEEYVSMFLKAIVTGRVTDVDTKNINPTLKGVKKAVRQEREWYWMYRTKDKTSGKIMGYGLVARAYDLNTQTARAGINSYRERLRRQKEL